MKERCLGDNIYISVVGEALQLTDGKKGEEFAFINITPDMLCGLLQYLEQWRQEESYKEAIDLYKEKKDA